MSNLFYRDLRTIPTTANYSANELIVDTNGRFLDDLSAGAGITCLGHSCDAIKDAMVDQIFRMPYCHAMNWSHQPAEELAEKLIGLTTRGNPNSKFNNGRVIFLNTGAEAIEAACKLAMQVGYEMGRSPLFYGRQYSYHGNTAFTLALGDHPKKRLYPFIDVIDENVERFDAYRPTVSPRFHLAQLAANLERDSRRKIQPIVVVEPIGGTTIGIEPSTKEYLDNLQIICDLNDAILIYDEVLCGNYRTGELFAYQYYDALEPDIICLGKGLTGGYFPLSAVIVSERLVANISLNSGKLWHSTTNQNQPIGCAAGIAALNEYEQIKDKLPGFGVQVQQMALNALSKVAGGKDRMVGASGVGSLLGIRFDPDAPGLHARVRREALANGIAVYTDGGTIDGKGNMVLLAPPYSYLQDMGHLQDCLNRLAAAVVMAAEPA